MRGNYNKTFRCTCDSLLLSITDGWAQTWKHQDGLVTIHCAVCPRVWELEDDEVPAAEVVVSG